MVNMQRDLIEVVSTQARNSPSQAIVRGWAGRTCQKRATYPGDTVRAWEPQAQAGGGGEEDHSDAERRLAPLLPDSQLM